MPSLPYSLALLALTAGALQPQSTSKTRPSGRGTVTGIVRDVATGRPIAGAEISVPQFGVDARADGNGRYTISGLTPGLFVARVAAPDYLPSGILSVRVRSDSATRRDFGLRKATGLSPLQCTGADSTTAPAPTSRTIAGDSGAVSVSWQPASPRQGTLFEVVLEPRQPGGSRDSVVRVSGTVAGEPLHFLRDGDRLRAVAAVPVDSTGSVTMTARIEGAGGRALSVVRAVPVADGAYRVERLAVAARFTRPPDSALARRMAAESRLAREVSAASHRDVARWRLPFTLPGKGRVTSGFGSAREFNGVVQSRHTGLDLAGGVGASVLAANRGVVALVADFYLAGRVIYVDHGAGIVTAYFHLSRSHVAVGETVARGQHIGAIGRSGRVTGPHLHWVARYGEVSVDPRSLLALPSRASSTPLPLDSRAGCGA